MEVSLNICIAFVKLEISQLPMSSQVTNMSHMFLSATAFNQNIGDWDVSKVTDMSYMLHAKFQFI
jgi:surface protein